MNENLLTSPRFIKTVTLAAIMLSVFLLAKTVYEFKASSLLGNDTPAVNTISVSGKGEVVAIPDI
ncbi:MAG: hypothetical protein WCW14_01815, partial [Candidatus Paceibacterota bacterium]